MREGLPGCPRLIASGTQPSGCGNLPQGASLGLPGRSKSWGHGCRHADIYTSGSGMGSPRKTGTWAQRRERHRSENLGEPNKASLRLLSLVKHFSVVRETTFTRSGRTKHPNRPLSLYGLSKPRISGLLTFTQQIDHPGHQGPYEHPPSPQDGALCC